MTSRPETAISLSGALIAFVAVFELPYGFYTFVRLAVTAAAISLIVFSSRRGTQAWLFGLIPIALLWNPVIPVLLTRGLWLPLDLAATAFFIVYASTVPKNK